jgi:hypothetical protein
VHIVGRTYSTARSILRDSGCPIFIAKEAYMPTAKALSDRAKKAWETRRLSDRAKKAWATRRANALSARAKKAWETRRKNAGL